MHQAVLKAIQLQIALAVNLREQVNAIHKMEKVNHSSKRIEDLLKSNQIALTKNENIQDNLYLDWKNGDISQEQHYRLRTKIEEKIEQLKQSNRELLKEKKLLESNLKESNHYLETFCQYQNIKELDSKILIELVDKIYIYENNIIDVKFNFQDEYKLTLEFIENNK